MADDDGKKTSTTNTKNLTVQADLASILASVLGLEVGKTFPLGVAIDNRTQYDLVQSDGYPFLPHADNPCVQCGQSGAKSYLGPTATPIRISAWTGPDSLSVGAFNGHGIGLDANVGCQSYFGVEASGEIVFQVLVAWFMGGGHGCKYAILLGDWNHLWSEEKGYPSALFLPGRSLATVNEGGTCAFGDAWTDAGSSKTKASRGHTFVLRGSPGGNKDGYDLTIEISQQGYAPPTTP